MYQYAWGPILVNPKKGKTTGQRPPSKLYLPACDRDLIKY